MRGGNIYMKNEKNKIPDFRVVFLMFVFLGLPIIVFLNWLTINNEVSILIKMITIIICVFLITVSYRAIRHFFFKHCGKTKINLVGYVVVQCVSLVITLIMMGIIVACIQLL